MSKDLLQELDRERALRRKWRQIWADIGERIVKMPKWMQEILLEDINTAILNRLALMELLQKSGKLQG